MLTIKSQKENSSRYSLSHKTRLLAPKFCPAEHKRYIFAYAPLSLGLISVSDLFSQSFTGECYFEFKIVFVYYLYCRSSSSITVNEG